VRRRSRRSSRRVRRSRRSSCPRDRDVRKRFVTRQITPLPSGGLARSEKSTGSLCRSTLKPQKREPQLPDRVILCFGIRVQIWDTRARAVGYYFLQSNVTDDNGMALGSNIHGASTKPGTLLLDPYTLKKTPK
jgi:hypothetical protein